MKNVGRDVCRRAARQSVWAPAGAVIMFLVVALSAPVVAGGQNDGLDVELGKALFKRLWVPAPSSTLANDGLGPLFNARSCAQCHSAAGGGRIAIDSDGLLEDRGAVVRLSQSTGEGDANYGAQLQTRAIQGHRAEASVNLDWKRSNAVLGDGSSIELRQPEIILNGLAFGPLAPETHATLMLAPSLEVSAQIARVDLDALDAADKSQNGDAKNGRLSRDAAGHVQVFGRKATEATIESAISLAFSRDLGLSTKAHLQPAGDCSTKQTACQSAIHGAAPGEAEMSEEIVAAMAAYLRSFHGPSHQDVANGDGSRLFETSGCGQCHQPELPGRDHTSVKLFSDLRLHDMGDGLAGLTEATSQSATEWRTAPLIGAGRRLRAGATLLHDGRARSVSEAILWHGGAAEAARERFKALSLADRAALEHYVLNR